MPYIKPTIKKIRKEYIKMAKQLCYPEETIRKLGYAESETECSNIMRDAREKL